MKETYLVFCLWIALINTFNPLAAQDIFNIEADRKPAEQKDTVFKNFKPEPKPVFVFNIKKDLPIIVGSGVLAIGGTLLKYNVEPLAPTDLAALDPKNINAFDRGAIGQYRVRNAKFSDYLLVANYLVPFSVLASAPVRKEFTAVLMMYAETVALVGGLTGITKGLIKRERPFTYNPDALLADKLSKRARHSFFSGHVSNSAALSFFTAYMVNRYADHPGWKIAAWTGAIILPGTIGYLRFTSGKHFPSDIIAGYLIGAGSGILIPYLHQWNPSKEFSFNVQPLPSGILITLRF